MFGMDEFQEYIFDNDIFRFLDEPLDILPGKKTSWILDFEPIFNDPSKIKELSSYVIDFSSSYFLESDCFYGVPESATRLGIITQYENCVGYDFYRPRCSLPMGKKDEKERFLGYPSGSTIILDDITLEGEGLVDQIDKLIDYSVNIKAVVTLCDRKDLRGEDDNLVSKIKDRGVDYYSMTDSVRLLSEGIKRFEPKQDFLNEILYENWRNRHSF